MRLTLGEIFLRSGRTDQAEDAFRRIWIELPGTPESRRAKDLLATIPTPGRSHPRSSSSGPRRCTSSAGTPWPCRSWLPSQCPGVRMSPRPACCWGSAPSTSGSTPKPCSGWSPSRTRLARTARRLSSGSAGAPAGRRPGEVGRIPDAGGGRRPADRRERGGLYLLGPGGRRQGRPGPEPRVPRPPAPGISQGELDGRRLWLQGWLAYKRRDVPGGRASGVVSCEEPGSRWRVPALFWRGRALEARNRPPRPSRPIGRSWTRRRTSSTTASGPESV